MYTSMQRYQWGRLWILAFLATLPTSAVLAQTSGANQGNSSSSPASASDSSASLTTAVGPFFQKNCETCHNSGLPSGSVDLQGLLAMPNSVAAGRETWQTVVSVLGQGQMPPAGAPKPPQADVDEVLQLIKRALAETPAAAAPAAVQKEMPATLDWLTFGYDPERTAWDRAETKISKATAPKIQLLWKLQTETVPDPIDKYSTLTEALVANNVSTPGGMRNLVFVGSRDNTLYAIDAEKGTIVWKRSYPNTEKPVVPESGNCPENMNATPVIDRQSGIIYFLPNDGKLRGVSISDGKDRFPATTMVPPYSRNFSLNLVHGRIFTSTTRGCADANSEVVSIDVEDPGHPVYHLATSPGKGSGMWGRGGIVHSPYGWLAQTADGAYDPAGGRWGMTMLGLNDDADVLDSFTPPNEFELDARDLDFGSSSPVVFPFGGRTLLAASSKSGIIYLLDAFDLGGKDHRSALYTSPRLSNDAGLFSYNGLWGVMTSYVDPQGKRWLFVPFSGPAAKSTDGLFKKTHGPTVNGQIMAFTVEGTADHPTLQPQWMSADFDLPGVVTIANGVLLVLASGDRAGTLIAQPPRNRPPSNGPRVAPTQMVDTTIPGYQADQEWWDSQVRPFDQGGQKPGTRFSGGRDTTHAVLYALDPATGDELYSSGDTIDSWNHYGEVALSDGKIFITTWNGEVFAFGLKK
jgi:outer membrane protein assembly factor BamB